MSTRQTIKYADDFHLYTDLLDRETGDKRPVYLSLNCEFAAYSAMVDLTLEDLKQMRPRVVNKDAYIDLLLSWASCADAEIKRLEANESPVLRGLDHE